MASPFDSMRFWPAYREWIATGRQAEIFDETDQLRETIKQARVAALWHEEQGLDKRHAPSPMAWYLDQLGDA